MPRWSCLICFLSALILGLAATVVRAERPPDADNAAEAFDAGVAAYQAEKFADAARAFLNADGLAPNDVALGNALSAALRSDDPRLIADAAQRATARHTLSETTRKMAEEALAHVRPRIAILTIACEVECTASLDGVPQPAGRVFVLPGNYVVEAGGARHPVACEAGGECRVEIDATAAPEASPEPAPKPQPRVPLAHQTAQPAARSRLPLVALIGSAGAAVGLGIATAFVGVRAIHANDLADTKPAAYEPTDVRMLARRADYLLAGTLAFAGAAAVTAIWWVDFGNSRRTTLALVPSHGATLSATTRF